MLQSAGGTGAAPRSNASCTGPVYLSSRVPAPKNAGVEISRDEPPSLPSETQLPTHALMNKVGPRKLRQQTQYTIHNIIHVVLCFPPLRPHIIIFIIFCTAAGPSPIGLIWPMSEAAMTITVDIDIRPIRSAIILMMNTPSSARHDSPITERM